MVGKASGAFAWRQATVNNFVAVGAASAGLDWPCAFICCIRFAFSRLGGPGLLTYSRFNDFELYRPARRAGLDPLTTTQEGVALVHDDSSILTSPGQACGKTSQY